MREQTNCLESALGEGMRGNLRRFLSFFFFLFFFCCLLNFTISFFLLACHDLLFFPLSSFFPLQTVILDEIQFFAISNSNYDPNDLVYTIHHIHHIHFMLSPQLPTLVSILIIDSLSLGFCFDHPSIHPSIHRRIAHIQLELN